MIPYHSANLKGKGGSPNLIKPIENEVNRVIPQLWHAGGET